MSNSRADVNERQLNRKQHGIAQFEINFRKGVPTAPFFKFSRQNLTLVRSRQTKCFFF